MRSALAATPVLAGTIFAMIRLGGSERDVLPDNRLSEVDENGQMDVASRRKRSNGCRQKWSLNIFRAQTSAMVFEYKCK
jgi:hypothetical protein